VLNHRIANADLVIFVSDNESWVDAGGGRGTPTMTEWNFFKQQSGRSSGCIDVQPDGTVQAVEREDILNVGGFSDQVFDVISEFVVVN
jgi:60 kDa SS-A/Ro ribonucleoprotein